MKKTLFSIVSLLLITAAANAVAYDTLQIEKLTGWSATIFTDSQNQTEMNGTVDVIHVNSTVNNAFRFTTPIQAKVNEFYYVAGANTTSQIGKFVGKFIYTSQGNRYLTSEKSSSVYDRFSTMNSGGVVNATIPYYYRGDAIRVAKIYFYNVGSWGAQSNDRYAGGNNITWVSMNIFESIINESNPRVINWGYWNATYDVSNHIFRSGAVRDIVTVNLTGYEVNVPYYLRRNIEPGFVSVHGSILDAVSADGFTIRYLRDGPNFTQINSTALANRTLNVTRAARPPLPVTQPFIPKSSNAKPDFVSGLVSWVKNIFGD